MADVNQIYQGEFLRAAQLGGQTRRVTIESCPVEVLGQGEKAQQNIVLKLARSKLRLPLNKTNALALSSAWGPMTDNWIGKQVELRPEKVQFQGAMVDSIRVQAVTSSPLKPAAPAPASTPEPATPRSAATESAGDWSPEELADDIAWDK